MDVLHLFTIRLFESTGDRFKAEVGNSPMGRMRVTDRAEQDDHSGDRLVRPAASPWFSDVALRLLIKGSRASSAGISVVDDELRHPLSVVRPS